MTESPSDPANYPLDGCEPVQPSLSFLAEAQPRLKTGEDKEHFLAEVHIKFFKRPHELQSKNFIGKITNFFCIYSYLFQIDTFINTY
jgi:hypothetical protein